MCDNDAPRPGNVDPETVPDEAIAVDLTGRYESNWMARGRKEHRYRNALAEDLVEKGYDADAAEAVKQRGFSGLSLLEEEWDEIWEIDADPATAMVQYIGEETVTALVEDNFAVYHERRTQQKAQYRPHIKEVHPEYFEEG